MIYLFLGPPGSGKSTQLERLAAGTGWTGFSMGSLIRQTADPAIKNLIESGHLVPQELAGRLVSGALDSRLQTGRDIIIDGFPRHIDQASWLIDRYWDHLGACFWFDFADLTRARARLDQRARHDDTRAAIQVRFDIFSSQSPAIRQALIRARIPLVYLRADNRSIETIGDQIRQVLDGGWL